LLQKGQVFLRKKDLVELYSRNGEFHLILKEHKGEKQQKKCNFFNFVELKDFMKKEAAKPLLLLRA
jgi:hypothetical protein